MFACLLFCSFEVANGYSANKPTDGRRLFLQRVAGAASAAALVVVAPQGSHASAVLSSKYCAGGVGEGCEDRAEGNEYIKRLQEKSAANREANAKEALLAYQMKNYPDFFASLNPPRYLVKKPDGTFEVFTDAELAELKKAGKIGVEIAQYRKAGGRDVTQKRILVLKE